MLSLYVVHDDEGKIISSFYSKNCLSELQIQEFELDIDDKNNHLCTEKRIVAATKKLFLAIIDKKQIEHESGLKVSVLQEGDHCLVMYDGYGYSKTLSFVEVMRRAEQFIVKDL